MVFLECAHLVVVCMQICPTNINKWLIYVRKCVTDNEYQVYQKCYCRDEDSSTHCHHINLYILTCSHQAIQKPSLLTISAKPKLNFDILTSLSTVKDIKVSVNTH